MKNIIAIILISTATSLSSIFAYENYIKPTNIVLVDIKRLLEIKDANVDNPMVGMTLFNSTKRYIEDKAKGGYLVLAKSSVINEWQYKDITGDIIEYSGIKSFLKSKRKKELNITREEFEKNLKDIKQSDPFVKKLSPNTESSKDKPPVWLP